MEEVERCFYQKELKTLLSSDPVLKIMKLKLIGSLQGPVSAPSKILSQLEAIRNLMKLLKEAGLIAEAFDAQKLLESDHDQVIKAGQSLFEKLIPLTGRSNSTDQAITQITEGYHTGSSQYASAESEADSIDSINIQRMSLGTSGAAFIRERTTPINTEARSTDVPTTQRVNPIGSGQLHAYFEAAMKKYEEDQQILARQNGIDQGSTLLLKRYTFRMWRWSQLDHVIVDQTFAIRLIWDSKTSDDRWWQLQKLCQVVDLPRNGSEYRRLQI